MARSLQKHAVVIGGSIAGLLAARVLSAAFEQVTIVERDELPAIAAERKGVPQSPQPHILLTKGYRILKELFPGIEHELLADGAIPVDWGTDFHYFAFGGWLAAAPEESELTSVSCTRPLLEAAVRRRVQGISNVQMLSPYRVRSLTGDAHAVTGVSMAHTHDRQTEKALTADLVIDASGRSTNASDWLAAIGQQPPAIDTVNAGLGYATRRYQLPPDWSADWKVMLIGHEPPDNSRLGYLAQVENNELIATLGGYENQYPPLEEDAFLAFAQQLSDPSFYKAIASLTPTTPIKAYRSTANKRRRYDQLEHMPTGFIAIGDAVCALCPAYGQGLTTSGQSAVVLQDWLSQNELTHTLAFQKKLEKAIKPSYDVAAGSDSGFVSTKGRIPKGRVAKVMNSYMRRLFTIAHTDGELNLSLIKIAHMIDSPIKLFHPKILLKMI